MVRQASDSETLILSDPRAAVEEELGTMLPEGVRVVAVEETADTIYLVLPSDSPIEGGGELSDLELEAVAGGGTWVDPTCASCDPAFAPSRFAIIFFA
jgi:hypothetical protein